MAKIDLSNISHTYNPNDPPMNIIEAKISGNLIKFEGIDVEAPQHLSN